MKNIVVISSTPRKGGNSDILCDAFVNGATEAGHTVEKIRIADLKIGYCTGCYACQKTGVCAIKDDAAGVIAKMMAADVIVLATPVYFYCLSAQLKALIDRTVVIFPKLRNKTFYYLMTMADTDRTQFEGTIKALKGFLDCYEGSRLAGMVCADGVYEPGSVNTTGFIEEAHQLGQSVR